MMKPRLTGLAALLLFFYSPSALAQQPPGVSGSPSPPAAPLPAPPPAPPSAMPLPTAPPPEIADTSSPPQAPPAAPPAKGTTSWGTTDTTAEPRYPLSETRKRWYGWKTAIGVAASDVFFGSAVLLIATGGKVDGFNPGSIILASTGLLGHTFMGPIVHWAHGNVGRGFLSLGMNLVFPGIGFGLGYAAGAPSGGADVGFIAGGIIGIVAAPAIDIALLAYEDVKVGASARGPFDGLLPVALVPIPIYGPDKVGLGVAGAF